MSKIYICDECGAVNSFHMQQTKRYIETDEGLKEIKIMVPICNQCRCEIYTEENPFL